MDMLITLIKLPHCTLSTYTITFINYFSITLVEGRGRVWEVFLYFELRKHSIIVCSSWRGRFQVSTKKKSKGKSSEAGSVIREWKKLSGLRWTALKGYTWKKQKKEDRAVITPEIRTMVCKKKKKMTFELTVKGDICNSKGGEKKIQTWENKGLHTA